MRERERQPSKRRIVFRIAGLNFRYSFIGHCMSSCKLLSFDFVASLVTHVADFGQNKTDLWRSMNGWFIIAEKLQLNLIVRGGAKQGQVTCCKAACVICVTR